MIPEHLVQMARIQRSAFGDKPSDFFGHQPTRAAQNLWERARNLAVAVLLAAEEAKDT